MSTSVRDSIENNQRLAFKIQNFMWEGKPHKSTRKEHTIEEYQEFLENLRLDAWESYDAGARELGWKD